MKGSKMTDENRLRICNEVPLLYHPPHKIQFGKLQILTGMNFTHDKGARRLSWLKFCNFRLTLSNFRSMNTLLIISIFSGVLF